MRIKLVACDLDGTLLTTKRAVSPRTAGAIAKAQAAGVKVCIATGRMFCSALIFARALGLTSPLIAYNGALVKDAASGEVYLSEPLDLTVAGEILAFAKQAGLYLQKYVHDNLYVADLNDEALRYALKVGIKAEAEGAKFYQLAAPPDKFLFVINVERQAWLAAELEKRFAGRVFVTSSGPRFVEVVRQGVNKGRALARLAQLYDVLPGEVLAAGDSYNDLEMLNFAGVGVAMGNAASELKAAAAFVSADNDHDGVAVAIERFVLC